MLVSSTTGSTLSIPDLNERETETDRQTEQYGVYYVINLNVP